MTPQAKLLQIAMQVYGTSPWILSDSTDYCSYCGSEMGENHYLNCVWKNNFNLIESILEDCNNALKDVVTEIITTSPWVEDEDSQMCYYCHARPPRHVNCVWEVFVKERGDWEDDEI